MPNTGSDAGKILRNFMSFQIYFPAIVKEKERDRETGRQTHFAMEDKIAYTNSFLLYFFSKELI